MRKKSREEGTQGTKNSSQFWQTGYKKASRLLRFTHYALRLQPTTMSADSPFPSPQVGSVQTGHKKANRLLRFTHYALRITLYASRTTPSRSRCQSLIPSPQSPISIPSSRVGTRALNSPRNCSAGFHPLKSGRNVCAAPRLVKEWWSFHPLKSGRNTRCMC